MGRKPPNGCHCPPPPHSQAIPWPVYPSDAIDRSLFESSFPVLVTTPQMHTVHRDQVPSVVTWIKKETLLDGWEQERQSHSFICTPTVLKDTLTNKRLLSHENVLGFSVVVYRVDTALAGSSQRPCEVRVFNKWGNWGLGRWDILIAQAPTWRKKNRCKVSLCERFVQPGGRQL